MYFKPNSFMRLGVFFSLMLSLTFYACFQEATLDIEKPQVETNLLENYSANHTQHFTAQDQGDGVYAVTGNQGTLVNIDNALVDEHGDRVRGTVAIELIEIYSVADMILHRKQTLADDNGQLAILQSGGEIFIQVYQNGKKLSVDGQGTFQVLLPTENTGGAVEGMEHYIGEEIGDQVIWKTTGKKIRVTDSQERANPYYIMLIQTILGWHNVDVIYGAGGDPVECIDLYIECPIECDIMSTTVAMHVNSVNDGVELVQVGPNQYQICAGQEGAFPLGGIDVTFIVIVECVDGSLFVAMYTVTLNSGHHKEFVDCDKFVQTDLGGLEEMLNQLK